MPPEKLSNTKHRIHDPDCSVAVISDLHKYSGVSNFSDGDNPFFEAYYQLYLERCRKGNIDLKLMPSFGDKDREEKQNRAIELEVKKTCSPDEIEQKIRQMFKGPKYERRIKAIDPKGKWARRQEVFDSFRKAKHVVLNGDIFDIECCTDQAAKIQEAVKWLNTRMDQAPGTTFHLVLGNHETFEDFIKAMEKLDGESKGQFQFHEHYLQINNTLFVHGDEQLGVAKYVEAFEQTSIYGLVKQGLMDAAKSMLAAIFKRAKNEADANDQLQTEAAPSPHAPAAEHAEGSGPAPAIEKPHVELASNEKDRRRGKQPKELIQVKRIAYEWFNGLYHKTNNLWHGVNGIVSTLYNGLEKSDTEGLAAAFAESRHVFSGHTHEPYASHYQDKYFYNTGAAVKSRFSEFRPLRIQMRGGIAERVNPLLKKDRDLVAQRPLVRLHEARPTKYFVVSDLHIGAGKTARYEKDENLQNTIDAEMRKADVVVLNGDVFDLTYSNDILKAKSDALTWLDNLVSKFPEKQIYYVLGNHEAELDFVERVRAMASKSNTFQFREHFYQTPDNKTVFLHGDEIAYEMPHQVLIGRYGERKLYSTERAGANAVERTGSNRAEGIGMNYVNWRRKPQILAPLVKRVIAEMPGVRDPEKVENVFIGHTHLPFIDYPAGKGTWVTNTGATNDIVGFAPVTFEMAADGKITPPRPIDVKIDLKAVRVNYY